MYINKATVSLPIPLAEENWEKKNDISSLFVLPLPSFLVSRPSLPKAFFPFMEAERGISKKSPQIPNPTVYIEYRARDTSVSLPLFKV